MSASEYNQELLHDELIARVCALDGKQHDINANRNTLSATVRALSECTNVDPATIATIADQLSANPRFIRKSQEQSEQDIRLARNTKIAKYCVIAFALFFVFSLLKWFNINNSVKTVLHDVSPVQSRIGDFYMRSGRYPYDFEKIAYRNGAPAFESVENMQMGPTGELLIDTNGFFGSQLLLTPAATNDGRTKWRCSTNASWLFKLTSWTCEYQASLSFQHH